MISFFYGSIYLNTLPAITSYQKKYNETKEKIMKKSKKVLTISNEFLSNEMFQDVVLYSGFFNDREDDEELIEEIDISFNHIEDSGVKTLLKSKNLQNLRFLKIGNNIFPNNEARINGSSFSITDSCAPDLASFLARTPSLEHLHLGSTQISNSGLELILGGSSLENHQLHTLNLSNTNISGTQVSKLFFSSHNLPFSNLTVIRLANNELGFSGIVDMLKALIHDTKITTLNLNNCVGKNAKPFPDLTNEEGGDQSLDLKADDETENHYNYDDEEEKISSSSSPTSRKRVSNPFSFLTELLSKNKTLTSLSLASNMILRNRFAFALARAIESSGNNTLQLINLFHCGIKSNGAKALFRALSNKNPPNFSEYHHSHVCGIKTLELSFNKIEGRKVEKELYDMVSTNETLTSLRLVRTALRGEGAASIFRALKEAAGRSRIRSLDLNTNEITDSAVPDLLSLLRCGAPSSLESLSLLHMRISSQALLDIIETLQDPMNNALVRLAINANHFETTHVDAIARSIAMNPFLTSLNFETFYSWIETMEEIKPVVESLRNGNNKAITTFVLPNNLHRSVTDVLQANKKAREAPRDRLISILSLFAKLNE